MKVTIPEELKKDIPQTTWGKILAATFHPELTGDTAVHEQFLKLARNGS